MSMAKMKNSRSQSAMEYLLTYGWALLIVAVAFSALFLLGVFNPNYFSPKAPTGSCSISRPFGPGTTRLLSLSGTCNNEIPQYVMKLDGATSYANTSVLPLLLVGANSITISAWINPASFASAGIILHHEKDYSIVISNTGNVAYANNANWNYGNFGYTNIGLQTSQWQHLVLTQNTNTVKIYLNGVLKSTKTFDARTAPTNYPFYIGVYVESGVSNALSSYYNGKMADVQLYNVSLPTNSVFQLYLEGIGGVPIDYGNLLGWWPLNGDVNDYSGNLNNGAASNAIYINDWYLSYTPP